MDPKPTTHKLFKAIIVAAKSSGLRFSPNNVDRGNQLDLMCGFLQELITRKTCCNFLSNLLHFSEKCMITRGSQAFLESVSSHDHSIQFKYLLFDIVVQSHNITMVPPKSRVIGTQEIKIAETTQSSLLFLVFAGKYFTTRHQQFMACISW